MNLPIKYAWDKDIIFHILNHMKVDNASDLFNPAYVKEINYQKETMGIKESLIDQISIMNKYYLDYFDKLSIINFIPLKTNSYKELTKTIVDWGTFTDEDRREFINSFLAILDQEKTFYQRYWIRKDNALKDRKTIVEKNLEFRLEQLECIFFYYKQHLDKQVNIILSYSIWQNGRACNNQDSLIVAIPFPIHKYEEEGAFFTALHELTHPCTDNLVGECISMKDGSHALTENIVMIADYELIKEVSPDSVESYFRWIANKYGRSDVKLDENMLYRIFEIPADIKDRLIARIQQIVKGVDINGI